MLYGGAYRGLAAPQLSQVAFEAGFSVSQVQSHALHEGQRRDRVLLLPQLHCQAWAAGAAAAVESAMGVPRSLAAPQVTQEPFDAGLTAPQGQRQGFGTVPVKGAAARDVAGLTGDDWGFRSSAKATGT